MTSSRICAALCMVLALGGCARGAPDAYVVAHRPPGGKDVIAAVLASESVKLSVHPSCEGVGTEAADATIGEYLSGFLSELSSPDGGNWLETSVENARSAAGVDIWRAQLFVRHSEGEDEWGWGVRFDIRQADGAVDPQSFQCLGAG